jgi:chemotaxis protein CheC
MTDSSAVELSELEWDALTELVNLGVSNAALSFREMVQQEVLLSVPKVCLFSRDEAIASVSKSDVTHLVGVSQEFQGEISGRALLIFPEIKSIELVRAVVGKNLSLDEIIELEQEALAEIGNVMMNSCLGTIANQLERSLKISLPEVIYGHGREFFRSLGESNHTDRILFIYINFALKQQALQGYIALLLDLPSLLTLKMLLGAYIEKVAGGAART